MLGSAMSGSREWFSAERALDSRRRSVASTLQGELMVQIERAGLKEQVMDASMLSHPQGL